MPEPLTQKGIEHNSLPLPATWADTIGLADYWERQALIEQFDPCVVDDGWVLSGDTCVDEDELGQEWLPGYDITDDHE